MNIDPRLLAQFFRDPQTGNAPMLPGTGGPVGQGGIGAGVPISSTFEVDPTAQAGVMPPPGYTSAPVTGDEGAYGPPPVMPPPPNAGAGGFMPMGGPRGAPGGMQPGGPYSGPPPSMQAGGPYQGPTPPMRDMPLPRQAPASSGVRPAVGDAGAREIAAQGDPSMMDEEKKQRLIQAIMRARGMIA